MSYADPSGYLPDRSRLTPRALLRVPQPFRGRVVVRVMISGSPEPYQVEPESQHSPWLSKMSAASTPVAMHTRRTTKIPSHVDLNLALPPPPHPKQNTGPCHARQWSLGERSLSNDSQRSVFSRPCWPELLQRIVICCGPPTAMQEPPGI